MKTANQAFEEYAAKFDTFGDKWQDMGADQYFVAGYAAAIDAAIYACKEYAAMPKVDSGVPLAIANKIGLLK